VDFQVFLCVPVYHKTLPIANFRLPICPYGRIALR